MNTQEKRRTKRNLVIFTISVLGLAFLAGAIESVVAEPGTPGLGQLLWIFAPVMVMLLLRILGGDGWDDFGWRPNFRGNAFWWCAAIFVMPLVIIISTWLGILFGGLTLNPGMFGAFMALLVPAFISALIKNIFEEFAWRGYLAPKIYRIDLNIWLAHAIVGMVWAVWHLPFMSVFWFYLSPETLRYFVPLFIVGCFADSIVYGEIRLATNSVLPAWIMHTLANTITNGYLLSNFIEVRSGAELWAAPGSAIYIVLIFFTGYWLHKRRKKDIKSVTTPIFV